MKLVPEARLMLSKIKEDLSVKVIEIIDIGKEYVIRAGLSPANQKSRLLSAARSFSSVIESDLKRNRQDLIRLTVNTLKNNTIKVDGLENTLEAVRPENVLKRGYTITSINGKILKSFAKLNIGEDIDTEFSDGTIKSRIVRKRAGRIDRVEGVEKV
jgi:exonuclease VII large subunit